MAWLRRVFGWLGRKLHPPEDLPDDPKAVRLADLSPGMRGRIVALQGVSTNSEARMNGLCILPGVVLHLSQRRPTFVIRIEETTVALDQCLAEAIWVRPLPLPDRKARMENPSSGT
jgi:Fe2+ transport system protein FeoA